MSLARERGGGGGGLIFGWKNALLIWGGGGRLIFGGAYTRGGGLIYGILRYLIT